MQVYIGSWPVFSESAYIVMGMDLGCIRDVRGNSKGVWALARAQIYIVYINASIYNTKNPRVVVADPLAEVTGA